MAKAATSPGRVANRLGRIRHAGSVESGL